MIWVPPCLCGSHFCVCQLLGTVESKLVDWCLLGWSQLRLQMTLWRHSEKPGAAGM